MSITCPCGATVKDWNKHRKRSKQHKYFMQASKDPVCNICGKWMQGEGMMYCNCSIDDIQKSIDKVAYTMATEWNEYWTKWIINGEIIMDIINGNISDEEGKRRLELLQSENRKDYLKVLKMYTEESEKE